MTEGALVTADFSAVTVAAPERGGKKGPGWKLDLEPGWKVVPVGKRGSFVLTK